jgi:hypothetical protein
MSENIKVNKDGTISPIDPTKPSVLNTDDELDKILDEHGEYYIRKTKQAILDLLESKAETFNQVEYSKSGSMVKTDVRAIPLSALRELEGK